MPFDTNTEISNTGWCLLHHGSLDAVVYPITHVHIPMPRLPKQRLITGAAPAVSVASGLALAISLCFHNHAPQQLPTSWAGRQKNSCGRSEEDCIDVVAIGGGLARNRRDGLAAQLPISTIRNFKTGHHGSKPCPMLYCTQRFADAMVTRRKGLTDKQKVCLYNLGSIFDYVALASLILHALVLVHEQRRADIAEYAFAFSFMAQCALSAPYKWDKLWMRIKTIITLIGLTIVVILYSIIYFFN